MIRRESAVIDAEKENATTKGAKHNRAMRRALAPKSSNLQLKKSTTSTNVGIKKPSLRRTNSSLPQIPLLPPAKNVFNRGSGNGPLVKRREIEISESEDDLEATFDTDQTANWGGLAKTMGLILEDQDEDLEVETTAKKDLPDLEDPKGHVVFTKDVLDGLWKGKEVSIDDPLRLDLKLAKKPLDLNVTKQDVGIKIDDDELELEFSDCDNDEDKLNSIMEFYK